MAAKRGLGKGLGAIFGEEVIKEQKEKIAMEDGKGKELMVKLSLIQPNKEPVSYTHLDVYKRQG